MKTDVVSPFFWREDIFQLVQLLTIVPLGTFTYSLHPRAMAEFNSASIRNELTQNGYTENMHRQHWNKNFRQVRDILVEKQKEQFQLTKQIAKNSTRVMDELDPTINLI